MHLRQQQNRTSKYTRNDTEPRRRNFFGCTKLRIVNMEEGLLQIYIWAFSKTALQEITIPNSVEHIGGGAFGDAQINVEEGNPIYEAKENCLIDKSEKKIISGGKNSKISQDVEIIRENSFSYSEIETINIPNNIQEINNFAFACCEKLKNVEIGNGVKIISEGAFFESGINLITIPSNVEEVEKGAFQCCKNLTFLTAIKKSSFSFSQ